MDAVLAYLLASIISSEKWPPSLFMFLCNVSFSSGFFEDFLLYDLVRMHVDVICFMFLGFVEILGLQFLSNWKHFGHYFFKYFFQSSILFPIFQVPQYTYLKSHDALFFSPVFSFCVSFLIFPVAVSSSSLIFTLQCLICWHA